MGLHEQRQQQKALQAKYLAAAKRLFLVPDSDCALKVSNAPNVHVLQNGGAFIDAVIWVPKEAIE